MENSISAVVRTTTSIPEGGCRNEDDKFRNAALVTTSLLKKLEVEPYDYIEARAHQDGSDWSSGVFVQAVPLADGFDEFGRNEELIIYMRTNVLRDIDKSLNPGNTIDIRQAGIASSKPLEVKRSYADDYHGERCYISDDIREQIGIDGWGNLIEVVHPQNGARTLLRSMQLEEWDDPDRIGLDLHSRELLDVETGDTVRVRRPVFDLRGTKGSSLQHILDRIQTKFYEFFIGRQIVSLRVLRGENQDEHRNIGRINRDMMNVLGMEPGELATIEWKGRTHTIQLLPPPDDVEVPALSIHMPSTERDQIGISIGDAVKAFRNMPHFFKKNLVTSLFGVIGVNIGIFEVVNSVSLFERLEPTVGVVELGAALIVVSVLVSIGVVWIILYPERQAVTKTEPR